MYEARYAGVSGPAAEELLARSATHADWLAHDTRIGTSEVGYVPDASQEAPAISRV
ncbi:MAG TPA: hypothetical protein VME46_15845 [Acidimicrobiales bacterium]|nr:hypothetical protein [Acidimicrobiales bacterium]